MRCFAIFVALAPVLPLSPEPTHAQVTLSLTMGPNIATWVWPERAERHESWSWHGGALGVSAGLPVAGDWGIQVGGGLSVKGWNDEGECAIGWETFACGGGKWITYFEATVLADRKIRWDDRFRLHLLAGPALGYQWDEFPQRAARYDFGIVGGAQIETRRSGGWGFLLGALYNHGLKNVDSGHVIDEWKDWYHSKSRTLTLHTGLSYTIG